MQTADKNTSACHFYHIDMVIVAQRGTARAGWIKVLGHPVLTVAIDIDTPDEAATDKVESQYAVVSG